MNTKRKALAKYMLERAKESSTWRGLILIAVGCGVAIEPAQQEAIVSAGLMLAGVVGAVCPDSGAQS